jgi:hypothetical protein
MPVARELTAAQVQLRLIFFAQKLRFTKPVISPHPDELDATVRCSWT